jgi:hypothetical protein
VRGAQPETVKNYDMLIDGQPVLSVRGNFQRKRIHCFDPGLRGKTVRIHVLATSGYPSARVVEARIY